MRSAKWASVQGWLKNVHARPEVVQVLHYPPGDDVDPAFTRLEEQVNQKLIL